MKPFYFIVKIYNVAFCAFVLIFGTGCVSNDISDLEQYIKEVKARAPIPIEPLPETKVVEPYIFDPEGLRDPFRPIDIDIGGGPGIEDFDGPGGGVRPDFTRRQEELESYSLDTLRMVGTLTMEAGLWGLVKASDGTIHRVQVGNYMGKNHGMIIRILDDSLELMEIVPGNLKGTWREQQASLALK